MLLLLSSRWVLAEPVIWRCEDLQKLKEFSSIQCAPDAQIYVPSRPNAGSFGAGANVDRRYIEFLNRHNLQGQEGRPATQGNPAPAPADNSQREGRNLQQFKTYTVPR